MSEFRPDPGRAASFGKGGGGILELIPGWGVFFSWMTRERKEEREKERELIPRKTEKKEKRNQGASIHHIGIHTRKLIFLENRKTIS